MADIPAKPVLLTGASGALGRHLAKSLGTAGWTLKLTDIVPFPDPMPANSSFTRADLNNGVDILRLAEGCGMILHFGGVATEHPFEDVLGPNIRGLYHIYEAARREKARVLFASSNHSIGFHERDVPLDDDCQFMPDGYYGLSKAYGELMGRMYWYKHGVENVNVRIGSSFPEPVDARMLSTWLSYDDLTRLCIRATLAEKTGSCVIWGASKNSRTYWRHDAREQLGWLPQDSADPYAGQLVGKVSDNPIQERYQGGAYPVMDYTRTAPPPGRLFGK
ncbi:NAD-dependent epimerase/dehydratase family protein [Limobrevibacterium gyesilva]|uniref:NAD(P)-dependent oxidoreductase n=1 Tax=Limobrevibacterium gyesilva TaxID=2991712 RepID=A0AA42CCK9_9PROT|nr:NAD(P)-dependent oxidoreductase [Limobrevibacterium gyesilva]MCW3473538.1 NAD(P)-dependent oxidoreductase [Limobrevibacterium gyesilva]